MAATYASDAELLLAAPSMAAAPVEVRDEYRTIAQEFVDVATCGTRSSQLHALATAHLLAAVGGYGGAAGVVASKAIGSLSVSYAVPAMGDDVLGSTRYGAAFLALRATVAPIVFGVVG